MSGDRSAARASGGMPTRAAVLRCSQMAWARWALAASMALAGFGLPTPVLAGKAGEVTDLSGVVVVRKADGQSRVLAVKSDVEEGDVVATTGNSYARVKFADGTQAVLRPGAQVKVVAFRFEEQQPKQDNVVLSLLKGGMRIVTGLSGKRNPEGFRVETPSAIVGIRGTNFGLQFCRDDCAQLVTARGGAPANGLHADVSDGAISLRTQAGSLVIGIGQFAFVQGPAMLPVLLSPREGTRIVLPPQAVSPLRHGGTVGEGGGLECEI